VLVLQDGSLFLLQIDPEDLVTAGSSELAGGSFLDFTLYKCDEFLSHRSDAVIGHANVPLEDVVHGSGERLGFDLVAPANSATYRDSGRNDSDGELKSLKKMRLYVRFRDATREDIDFISEYSKMPNKVGVYANETYLPVRPPSGTLLKFQQKKGKSGRVLYRTKPFPDPARPEQTAWMTKEQIVAESNRPSTHWVESGSGNLGKLYVELLGCDGLPNMDIMTANVFDSTDAFACLIYEDGLVNTDVIGDCLSPRWMPWCRRAFVFNIGHPSSNLLIGVFDYNPEMSPSQMVSRVVTGNSNHDPIGRVQVQISNFAADTVYTLSYPLFPGGLEDQRQESMGKLWIRIRKEWSAPRSSIVGASARLMPSPAKVSIPRFADYEVARYTAEGPYDDTGFDLAMFARYIKELQLHRARGFASFKRAALLVILWRGHYPVRIFRKDMLLPLHSITAFVWANIVAWDYNRILSFFLFSIGWILLAFNELVRSNPSPWDQKRGYWHLWWVVLTGANLAVRIDPYQDIDDVNAYQEQEEQQKRWLQRDLELKAGFIAEMKQELGYDVLPGFIPPMIADVDTTPAESGILDRMKVDSILLKPVLHPIQLKLRRIVIGIRKFKSFLLWDESICTFWVVTASLVASILTFWVPFEFIVRWALRFLSFFGLGPWNMIFDRLYFREPPGMTDEQRDAEIRKRWRAKHEKIIRMAAENQLRKEQEAKQDSMKTFMFGKYHVSAPNFGSELFQDTPLPESFAIPCERAEVPPVHIAERKFDQHLEGVMIPKREFQIESARRAGDGDWSRSVVQNLPWAVGSLAANAVEGIASGAGNLAAGAVEGIASGAGKATDAVGNFLSGSPPEKDQVGPPAAERTPLLGRAVEGIGRKIMYTDDSSKT